MEIETYFRDADVEKGDVERGEGERGWDGLAQSTTVREPARGSCRSTERSATRCEDLSGRRGWEEASEGGDICAHVADSCCGTSESKTAL